ncbi:type II toxin-antitoxin system prevent-host-death family antitoxin [Methylonatrum kenyense]|uniref:type II toxin-antitoxin system Phd/YefM family antitoxin n=1 Tax=Methylonatrum kenyense TaxID=455253 RepID=UPI0020BF8B28|nr:type II toxin-antitoxin system prevent-host-death family antitoxin [Methylonatrum kenyense]MCK8516935.1 type II toxin-antitoxin system prevent-host-death family antitoxin [Methylonatrum kenyense]
METVNMHKAKTELSRLVERASKGEPFVIARAGHPLVRVVAIDAPASSAKQRIGFLKGEFRVPDDFDSMDHEAIQELFEGQP